MKNPVNKKPTKKDEFEILSEEVEEELKKLSWEEVVRFAWRCAVRALPLLGRKGNFNFWKAEDQKKNLQAVFYAIDITTSATYAAYAAYAASTSDADAASFASAFAAYAYSAASTTTAAASDASSSAYTGAAYAAAFAAYTAAYAYAADVRASAASADAASDAATAAARAYAGNIGFDPTIFLQLTIDELKTGSTSGGGAGMNYIAHCLCVSTQRWNQLAVAIGHNGIKRSLRRD